MLSVVMYKIVSLCRKSFASHFPFPILDSNILHPSYAPQLDWSRLTHRPRATIPPTPSKIQLCPNKFAAPVKVETGTEDVELGGGAAVVLAGATVWVEVLVAGAEVAGAELAGADVAALVGATLEMVTPACLQNLTPNCSASVMTSVWSSRMGRELEYGGRGRQAQGDEE